MISIEEKSSRQNSCKKNFLIIPSLDYPHLDKEIDFLYSTFRKTGVPDHIIHSVHNAVKEKFFGYSPSVEGRSQDQGRRLGLLGGRSPPPRTCFPPPKDQSAPPLPHTPVWVFSFEKLCISAIYVLYI